MGPRYLWRVRWTGPRPGRQHSLIRARGLPRVRVEWPLGWAAGQTDEGTGRSKEQSCATGRARALKLEPGSDKGWSGGRSRGRAGWGQSWAGPGRPLPPQRWSQTLCEWRARRGAGREGRWGGGDRPMGAWSASPRCRDWRNSDRGWGVEGSGAEPRRKETQGRAQHAKTETQTGSRERDEETIREAIEAALAR